MKNFHFTKLWPNQCAEHMTPGKMLERLEYQLLNDELFVWYCVSHGATNATYEEHPHWHFLFKYQHPRWTLTRDWCTTNLQSWHIFGLIKLLQLKLSFGSFFLAKENKCSFNYFFMVSWWHYVSLFYLLLLFFTHTKGALTCCKVTGGQSVGRR